MSKINADQWDAFVRQQPRAHVLQLSAWGALKCAYGWQAEQVIVTENDQIIAGAQILFRPLPMKLGSLAYLPFGGYVRDASLWSALWREVRHSANQHRAALLKWEAGIYLETPPNFATWGFQPSPQTIQPPNTILLDISRDDEAILAGMNQGTRRKVRQSLKNEIVYSQATRVDVGRFTALMHQTGERNEFGVHEAGYYELAYDLFVPKGDAALFLAHHEGDDLAGIMVFALGDTAWYLYGASSNTKRNLMASYGIQWQAIQWAKAKGCRWYDFWGIPDADEMTLEAQFQTRSDGLWGVYGFKRGWGGMVKRSVGAWDLVYNPLIYRAYRWVAERRSES